MVSSESYLDRLQARLPGLTGPWVAHLRESDILLFAGALAFYGLVSVAPMLVLTFSVVDWVGGEQRIERLGRSLDELVPAGITVSGVIQKLAGAGAGAGIGSLVAALWPATAYGSGLMRSFDRITDGEDHELRGLRGRARALVLVVLLPMFVLGGLVVSYWAASLLDGGVPGMVLGWALALVSGFAATWLVLLLLYQLYGAGPYAWRSTAVGAAAASAAISVMTLAYVVYLGRGADFEQQVAGSGLAAVVLLALWLYLANVAMLAGYSLTQQVQDRRGQRGGDASSVEASRRAA